MENSTKRQIASGIASSIMSLAVLALGVDFGRKTNNPNSKIHPIQIYELQQFGNTNSERFVEIDGIKFYSHIEELPVERYVSYATNLQGKVEGLKIRKQR